MAKKTREEKREHFEATGEKLVDRALDFLEEPVADLVDDVVPLVPDPLIDAAVHEVFEAAEKVADKAVAAVAEIAYPDVKRRREPRSVGVERVRRTGITDEPMEKSIDAYTAGDASELFGRLGKTGGAAFARWVAKEYGVKRSDRRPRSEWEALLLEFAGRPIHGHRRTPEGGNHRPNRHHIRGR